MDAYRTYKLSDALDPPLAPSEPDQGGKPAMTPEIAAEQVRESKESTEAKDAEASNRERMIRIGRGNQQAGRQGQ